MTKFKYVAAVLALVAAVGSVQAAGEVGKDQVQFMDNQGLSEIQGATVRNAPTFTWDSKLPDISDTTFKDRSNEVQNRNNDVSLSNPIKSCGYVRKQTGTKKVITCSNANGGRPVCRTKSVPVYSNVKVCK
jgi:hypothetical protein